MHPEFSVSVLVSPQNCNLGAFLQSSSDYRLEDSLVSPQSGTAVQVAQRSQSHYSCLDERCAGAELMMVITQHICCRLD